MEIDMDLESPEAPETPEAPEGSGAALIKFLTYVGSKGYVNGSTIAGFKTAARKVLLVTLGEQWESINVTNQDSNDLQSRFTNLTKGKFDVASVSAYIYRFETSLHMYKAYLENPLSTPSLASRNKEVTRPTGTRNSTRTTAAGKQREKSVYKRSATGDTPASLREGHENQDERIVRYPFPLREDLMVWVHLPTDLTLREAKRLVGFIESLAIDEVL